MFQFFIFYAKPNKFRKSTPTKKSEPVHACGDCFKVSGPAEGRVESFSMAPGSNSTYHVSLAWEKGYSGPVVLDAEKSR